LTDSVMVYTHLL